MKFRLKKTKKGGVDVGRLEIFKERYEDLNMPLDPNKPLEYPEFVAIITGDPAHRLDVCMCIQEKGKKGRKKPEIGIGFISLLYMDKAKSSFKMSEFVGLLSFLQKEKIKVIFDFEFTKREGIWEYLSGISFSP